MKVEIKDLQGENGEVTPGAGSYKNKFLKFWKSALTSGGNVLVFALDIAPEITIGITAHVTAELLEEARNQILDLMFKMLGPLPLQPGVNIPQALQFLLDPSHGPIVDG